MLQEGEVVRADAGGGGWGRIVEALSILIKNKYFNCVDNGEYLKDFTDEITC